MNAGAASGDDLHLLAGQLRASPSPAGPTAADEIDGVRRLPRSRLTTEDFAPEPREVLRRAMLGVAATTVWTRTLGAVFGLIVVWVADRASLTVSGDPTSAQELAPVVLLTVGGLITLVNAVKALASLGAVAGYRISRLIRPG